jgi:hypothetical protein
VLKARAFLGEAPESMEKKMAALFLNAAHPNLCRASMLDQPVRAGLTGSGKRQGAISGRSV